MAYEIPGLELTLRSSGDMSSHQYKAVAASTTNVADGAILTATRGGALNGIWQDNSTETTHGKIQFTGVSKVAAGDSSGMENAITLGSQLVASSQGQAVPSTASGLYKLGIAMESLSTGSTGIIAVQLTIGAVTHA